MSWVRMSPNPGETRVVAALKTPHHTRASGKGFTRPVTARQPARRHLKTCITDEKRAQHPAKMNLVDAKFLHQFDGCNRDIGAIEVGHRAQHKQPKYQK